MGSAGKSGVTLRSRIGEALAQMRIEADLTQEDVAEALGVAQSIYSRIEHGAQRLYLDQMLAAEAACRQPAGHVLRLAGLIKDRPSVLRALEHDPKLTDTMRAVVIAAYRSAARASSERSAAATKTSAETRKSRRS